MDDSTAATTIRNKTNAPANFTVIKEMMNEH